MKNEKRNLKVQLQKSGTGSENARINIPITWAREIGITKEDRDVEVIFVDGKIIIQKMKFTLE